MSASLLYFHLMSLNHIKTSSHLAGGYKKPLIKGKLNPGRDGQESFMQSWCCFMSNVSFHFNLFIFEAGNCKMCFIFKTCCYKHPTVNFVRRTWCTRLSFCLDFCFWKPALPHLWFCVWVLTWTNNDICSLHTFKGFAVAEYRTLHIYPLTLHVNQSLKCEFLIQ